MRTTTWARAWSWRSLPCRWVGREDAALQPGWSAGCLCCRVWPAHERASCSLPTLSIPAPLQALTYSLAEGANLDDIEEKDRYYISDEYKRKVLEHMSVPQVG